MDTNRKRRQLQRFYNESSLCRWCGIETILLSKEEKLLCAKNNMWPSNMATLDHLRSRFDPTRYEPSDGVVRHTLACYTCNQRRSRDEMKIRFKEEHRRRSLHLAPLAIT